MYCLFYIIFNMQILNNRQLSLRSSYKSNNNQVPNKLTGSIKHQFCASKNKKSLRKESIDEQVVKNTSQLLHYNQILTKDLAVFLQSLPLVSRVNLVQALEEKILQQKTQLYSLLYKPFDSVSSDMKTHCDPQAIFKQRIQQDKLVQPSFIVKYNKTNDKKNQEVVYKEIVIYDQESYEHRFMDSYVSHVKNNRKYRLYKPQIYTHQEYAKYLNDNLLECCKETITIKDKGQCIKVSPKIQIFDFLKDYVIRPLALKENAFGKNTK